jgi:hypothetical protein
MKLAPRRIGLTNVRNKPISVISCKPKAFTIIVRRSAVEVELLDVELEDCGVQPSTSGFVRPDMTASRLSASKIIIPS